MQEQVEKKTEKKQEQIKSVYDCVSDTNKNLNNDDDKSEGIIHQVLFTESKEDQDYNCKKSSDKNCCSILKILQKFVQRYNPPYAQVDFLLKELKYVDP